MWIKKENDMTNNFGLISGTKTGTKDFVISGDSYYLGDTLYSDTALRDSMVLD